MGTRPLGDARRSGGTIVIGTPRRSGTTNCQKLFNKKGDVYELPDARMRQSSSLAEEHMAADSNRLKITMRRATVEAFRNVQRLRDETRGFADNEGEMHRDHIGRATRQHRELSDFISNANQKNMVPEQYVVAGLLSTLRDDDAGCRAADVELSKARDDAAVRSRDDRVRNRRHAANSVRIERSRKRSQGAVRRSERGRRHRDGGKDGEDSASRRYCSIGRAGPRHEVARALSLAGEELQRYVDGIP